MDIQSTIVNSKSSGLGFLFRIISSSNYREVDIKICNPQTIYYQFFPPNISFGRIKGLKEAYLLRTKTYFCYYRQLLKQITNRSFSLNSVCPKFISYYRVFRKIEVRIFKVVHCLTIHCDCTCTSAG